MTISRKFSRNTISLWLLRHSTVHNFVWFKILAGYLLKIGSLCNEVLNEQKVSLVNMFAMIRYVEIIYTFTPHLCVYFTNWTGNCRNLNMLVKIEEAIVLKNPRRRRVIERLSTTKLLFETLKIRFGRLFFNLKLHSNCYCGCNHSINVDIYFCLKLI